jgi:hypothetical protein
MTHHVKDAHKPKEIRLMSNIGHWVEGAIMTGSGVLLMREALADRPPDKLASDLLAGAGALLGIGLVAGSLEHGGPVAFFRTEAQQREHLQMAALLTGGGLARRAGSDRRGSVGARDGANRGAVPNERATRNRRGSSHRERQARPSRHDDHRGGRHFAGWRALGIE